MKTKYIEVSTTDSDGFNEMSTMSLEIERLVKTYQADYNVEYRFK